ncbi:Aquaporin-12A, putative [Pediculus humanus corporis]|uniref:Aquaporin-12A, putative n=1 Tax=Pediculus humanus subsp. corporis TaxID=121224 RepID=E0VE25_PEDHC|nr:Aquaporin-12A, putative [Pediculus humanus corporis]EEB11631.1 Aquaporin-12A, putative [Pediculus humanus corporis]
MVELTSRRTLIIGILIAVNTAYFLSKRKNGKYGFFHIDLPDVVCFSPSKIAVPLEQLSFSTAVIVLICTLSHCLRKIIEEHVSDSLIRILLQEAVVSADLCGCCFELIIVADNFGIWMYGFYLFLLTIWWSNDWGNANGAPNVQLDDVVLGKQDLQLSLTKIWAQLTGGIFVYKLMQYIWSLELIENHENRAYEDCTADLQVSALQGFLIEGGGTLVYQLISKIINDMQPRYGTIIDSFIATTFDRTGGYYNPVLATSHKFGCEGNTFKEHIFVYWFGTCLGSALSVFLYNHTPLKNVFINKKTTKKTTTTDEQDIDGFWDKSD